MNIQRKYLLTAAVIFAAALAGWRLFGQGGASGSQEAAQEPKPVPVVAGVAAQGDVPTYVAGVGAVQAYNTVTIQARVDGELESVDFREGQDVHVGDRLAQIDARPFQAALDGALANLAKDQANLANARRDLQRYQETAQKGFSSRQQLDTQVSAVAVANAAIQADEAAVENARVQLGYTTIVSPIEGRTGIRRVDKGNIVHAADTTGLVVVTQLQPIAVIFTLPQDALPLVSAAESRGPVPVFAFARDGVSELGEGMLELVDNQIDPATGTIRLKARFPNPALSLWPGQLINARLQTGVAHDAVTVDSRVIQRGPHGAYAYVIKPDDTIEMRPVEPGQDFQGHVLVVKGLTAGERVVVDGQMRLEPGVKVSEDGAGSPRQAGQPSVSGQ